LDPYPEQESLAPLVAVVDFGCGNLYSVCRACNVAGLRATLATTPDALTNASAVIIPGVGAFGDAMHTLRKRGLDVAIWNYVATGRPVVGICLGIQLLMSDSYEFGHYNGLGLVPGTVVRFPSSLANGTRLRIPHVQWNTIHPAMPNCGTSPRPWHTTLLSGLVSGDYMYFVHSYYVHLENAEPLAITSYGETTFCAALQYNNIFACQFHPERSGSRGLIIYHNLAKLIANYPPSNARLPS